MEKEELREENNPAEAPADNTRAKPEPFNPDAALDSVRSGKLTLAEPIMDGSAEYTELEYNFSLLKGFDVARALDFGTGRKNGFELNSEQALNLFACAAAKCQKAGGLDATDIRERMGIDDVIKAVQIASLFFRLSSRAGDRRLSKK